MINKILIILGATILFFTLFLFTSFRKREKVEFGIIPKKITIINNAFHLLILFFFIGYCLIASQIYDGSYNSQLVMVLSLVLFFGSIFVVITIFLLKIMLKNIVNAKLNQVDSLTSLYNKMSGNCKICEILKSDKDPIFLAILDLDNFKKMNDIYGHLMGDEVLVKISNIIKSKLSKADVGCRFGGDEFVICLTHRNEKQASLLFNEIRKEINEIAKNYSEALLSVSIGVAYGIGEGAGGSSSCKSLMQNADKALYHIKKNGKNGVHIYSEGNNIYN